jgi:membrane peptidoglycan carboxypeptidase
VNRYRNPAVDWTRLAFAIISLGASRLGIVNSAPGASTLATQIEKYRHSPDGITESFGEKIPANGFPLPFEPTDWARIQAKPERI